MYPEIKFTTKYWFDLYNFYSKVTFGTFVWENTFLLFFAEFELLMFHKSIVKIAEKINKRNLLKICLQVIYPTYFCVSYIQFIYYRKKWKYLMFINQWQE